MRVYNITTTLKAYGNAKEEIKKDTLILADNDDISEHIQMMYGSWFEIVKFDVEEANLIHISKNYIKQEAIKLLSK